MTFRDRLLSRRGIVLPKGRPIRMAVVLAQEPKHEWWTTTFANRNPTIDLYLPEHTLDARAAILETAEKRRNHWEAPMELAALEDAQRLFSIMSAAHAKKRYELKLGFEYDVCLHGNGTIEMGYDIPMPKRGVIYSPVTYDRPTLSFAASLDFFYGDSCTFDKACQMFRFLPFIPKTALRVENPTSAHALHYHLSMLGIEVEPL